MNGVAFSPDDNTLATANSNGTVRLWNPVNGEVVDVLLATSYSVNEVGFSPDDKILATAGNDGTVQLWTS